MFGLKNEMCRNADGLIKIHYFLPRITSLRFLHEKVTVLDISLLTQSPYAAQKLVNSILFANQTTNKIIDSGQLMTGGFKGNFPANLMRLQNELPVEND